MTHPSHRKPRLTVEEFAFKIVTLPNNKCGSVMAKMRRYYDAPTVKRAINNAREVLKMMDY